MPSISTVGVPTWVQQGPAQEGQQLFGNVNVPDNDVAAAVESIAVDPNNPAHIIVGAADGGVWQTTNANPTTPTAITWTPLTDQLPSLAIGVVAFDPTDPTGNSFYAGTGLFSNSFDSGDSAVGLYHTTNDGSTWSILGNGTGAITAASGTPITITSANNGLTSGDQVTITGVQGNPAANGTFTVTVVNANQFSLNNTSSNGTYTGGGTWTGNILNQNRIKALVVTGSTILVGTINGTDIGDTTLPGQGSRDYATLGGAMFRSTNGGMTFSPVLTSSGLPAGAVSSLVVDPNDSSRIFAAVDGVGVFRSENGGATWNAFSTGLTGAGTSGDIELATQNNGGITTLFAGVSQETATTSSLAVFSATSFSGSGNWTALATPPVPAGMNYAGAGFAEKFQLIADPTNAGVVYIDGEGGTGIFRYNPAGAGSWVQIDMAGGQGTTPHADSRDLKFVGTTLLESDDGGIFFDANPTSTTASEWQSFNGNLADHEVYSVAYDPVNKVILEGTQDTGSPLQNATNSQSYADVTGGDGAFQAVDPTSLGGGNVLDYSLSDNFNFFNRNEYNNADTNINNNGLGGPTFAISSVSSGAGLITITASTAGLLTGDGVFITGVEGNTAANAGWIITVVDGMHFSLNGSSGSGAYLGGGNYIRDDGITSVGGTAGTPVIITTPIASRLVTGDQVFVNNFTGAFSFLNTNAFGSTSTNNYYVTVIDSTHFSLNGTSAPGGTSTAGFYGPSNAVMLKSAIGAANFSGLNAADKAFMTSGAFNLIPFVLNSVNPRQMLIGFNGVYEDTGTTPNAFAGDVIGNITSNLSGLSGVVTSMVYGGQFGGTGFANVALVGNVNGQLFFRGQTGSSFTNVTAALGAGGAPILSIAVNPTDWKTVYVVTPTQVFFTADITNLGANPFKVIGGGANDDLLSLINPLGSEGPEFRTVTVIGSTPVVGGLGGAYRMLTPPAGDCPMATWTLFGQGLPNVVVRALTYDPTTDTLVAGTMGRGAWTISNASATVGVSAVLTIDGNMGMSLQKNPNDPLQYTVADGTGLVESFDKSLFSQVNFDGLAGGDSVAIDATVIPLDTPTCPDFMVAVVGGVGNNFLQVSGPSTGTTVWNISAANMGTAGVDISFMGVQNLTGGANQDLFDFGPAGKVSGVINGNGGPDFLNYSAVGSSVTVNLGAGTASLTGGVMNIHNVIGSMNGGDTITGDSTGGVLVGHNVGNTITGGSGKSVLIGGYGKNLVQGNSTNDIIIGGKTNYDANVVALIAILNEWQGPGTFGARVAALRSGVEDNNGQFDQLVLNSTVICSAAPTGPHFGHGGGVGQSTLVGKLGPGNLGQNWYFTLYPSAIVDLTATDVVN